MDMRVKRVKGSDRHGHPPTMVGMVAWYRNKVGVVNINGSCSQWSDSSNNNNHLLQATAANRPTIGSGGALQFNGSTSFMRATFTLAQPCTIYIAFRQAAWVSGGVIIDGSSATSTLAQTTASPGIAANAGSALSVDNTIPVSAFGGGVACFVGNGASSVYQAGGGAASVTTTGNAGTNSPGGITVGCDRSSANFSNIRVREIMVYNVAHDANTRLQTLRYMARVENVGGV